jgi:DNA-binding transcriptional LysR family regulator
MDRLQTLMEVAAAGSIAMAAGKADLSRQSQYSRQLKELEEFFDRKLTEKRGRTLTLTSDGRRLATMAREQFQTLQHFAAETGGQQITARIGAGEGLLTWMLIPTLQSVTSNQQPINWVFSNLQTETMEEQLLDRRLDFALLRGARATRPLQYKQLGILQNTLFVPTHLITEKHNDALAVITHAPLAVLEGATRIRRWIEAAFEAKRLRAEIRFECASQPEIAALISAGLAAGILPRMASSQFIGKDVRSFNLYKYSEHKTTLSLAWHPRTMAISKDLEILRDALIAALPCCLAL